MALVRPSKVEGEGFGNELVLPVEGPGPASSTDGVGLGVSLTAVREESRAEGEEGGLEEGREGEVEDLGSRVDLTMAREAQRAELMRG